MTTMHRCLRKRWSKKGVCDQHGRSASSPKEAKAYAEALFFHLILSQIKTPSGEIRASSEGVLLHDVMRSEGVRGLQCPSGAVCAAAGLVRIAYAECVVSFGGSDSHFAKEAACISHVIGEDI